MRFVTGFVVTLLIALVLIPALTALPVISINVGSVISSSVYSYIRAGLYFLPMGTVGMILTIQISLWVFRLIVAVVRTMWDLLPFN